MEEPVSQSSLDQEKPADGLDQDEPILSAPGVELTFEEKHLLNQRYQLLSDKSKEETWAFLQGIGVPDGNLEIDKARPEVQRAFFDYVKHRYSTERSQDTVADISFSQESLCFATEQEQDPPPFQDPPALQAVDEDVFIPSLFPVYSYFIPSVFMVYS